MLEKTAQSKAWQALCCLCGSSKGDIGHVLLQNSNIAVICNYLRPRCRPFSALVETGGTSM